MAKKKAPPKKKTPPAKKGEGTKNLMQMIYDSSAKVKKGKKC